MEGLTRRRFNALVGGALGAGMLGAEGIARGAAIEDGTLRVGVDPEWFARVEERGLNPFAPAIGGAPHGSLLTAVYEPGVVFTEEGPMPWLYESFEPTDDDEVEATLREGVTWNDGLPLTPEDVAFSAQYVPRNGGVQLGGGGAYQEVVEAAALDERTVLFALNDNAGDWLGTTLAAPVFPAHRWEGTNNPRERVLRGEDDPVGTGPFRVEEMADRRLRLVARDDPGPRGDLDGIGPNVDAIEFSPVGGAHAQAIAQGELDLAPSTLERGAPTAASRFRDEADDDAPLRSVTGRYVGSVVFNTRRRPFDEAAFRRGLARLWDDGFHAEERGPNRQEGHLIVPPSLPWLRPAAPSEVDDPHPFPTNGDGSVDVAAARGLLATADGLRFGAPRSDTVEDEELYVDDTPFSDLRDGPMEILTRPASPTRSLERWADVLNRVGVPATVAPLSEGNAVQRAFVEQEFDAIDLRWGVQDGWLSQLPQWLGPAGRSDSGPSVNLAGYDGADDELRAMARRPFPPGERQGIVGAVIERVLSDVPLFVRDYPLLAEGVASDVGGVRYGLGGADNTRTWWSVGGDAPDDEDGASNDESSGEPNDASVATSNATVRTAGDATVVDVRTDADSFAADLSGTPIDTGGGISVTGIEGAASGGGRITLTRDIADEYYMDGPALGYLRIDDEGFRASDVTVRFSLSDGMVEPYSSDPDDLALHRRRSGEWEALSTEMRAEKGVYRFSATTPGFSRFAVAQTGAAGGGESPLAALESNPVLTGAGALAGAGLLALGNRLRKSGGSATESTDGDEADEAPTPDLSALTSVPGISEEKAESLHRNGFETRDDLRAASHEELRSVPGVGNPLAARITAEVGVEDGEESEGEPEAAEAEETEETEPEAAEPESGADGEPEPGADGETSDEPEEAKAESGADGDTPELPPVADSFAADCSAVGSLRAGSTDGPLHTYAGTLADGTEAVFRVVAPGVEVGEAFTDTARSWAGVDSDPQVATVHDYGDEPRRWLAHEPLDGVPLSECLDDDLECRVEALGEVCVAVRNAGRYSVRHRDLAPDRVYLTDDGEITVAGWGLDRVVREAAAPDAPPTHYMAPEDVSDGPVGPATDVYQLGALAYHVVTGEPPFADVPEGELADAIREERPTAPGEIDPELSAFDSRIAEAMAKEMRERYDSPHHLRRGLLAAL